MAGAALGLALLEAACGGSGGGVQSTPTPVVAPVATPTPTPTPVPTPTPTPTATYNTQEYRQTLGAVDMNALAAYQAGATGAGIAVAVIDSGIDTKSDQFAGRILAASQATGGGASIADESGHGTAVAFTLAGRRNGTGAQGVAFDASLLVLRADTPGTCQATASGGEATGCSFDDGAIARGVDAARAAGARIVNLSLGGSAPSQALVAAVDRATAAGIVIVVAAGNDGGTNPDAFALVANQAVARGLVVVAGSINAPAGYQNESGQAGTADTISAFSNRAGEAAAHYLTAVGTRVVAPDNQGTTYLWTGTSFATPQIAAAAALLAQAFPNLTGAQIVAILFSSARDAGAAGVDTVYGQGILDLTRAFQPLGGTSVAGGRAVSLSLNGTLSTPMGDAGGSLRTAILDGYGRAFAADLGRTLARAAVPGALLGALGGTTRVLAGGSADTGVSVTFAPTAGGLPVEPWRILGDSARGRVLASLVTQRLGERGSLAFGVAQGAAALSGVLAGAPRPAFLVAADPLETAGFDARAGAAAAMRRALGGWGLTASAEAGAAVSRGDAPALAWSRAGRWRYTRAALALDRRVGPIAATLSATRLAESDTVLGARLGDALGAPGATTWFADARAAWTAGGWSLGLAGRRGWTHAAAQRMDGDGWLITQALAADMGRALPGGASAGLRIAQPLRVTGGGITWRLPGAWDYATASVSGWTEQRLNLSPTGRELDLEARYARPLAGGALEANLFWRRQPGNIAALPPDTGAALRWRAGW